MISTPHAAPARRRRAASRGTGIAMVAEAATFALASAVHFATGFSQAAIPELVIAAVLGAGSSAVLTQRARAWCIAVGATAFATSGTVLGLAIIAAGRQDVPDLAYHASILAALAGTLIALVRARHTPAAARRAVAEPANERPAGVKSRRRSP